MHISGNAAILKADRSLFGRMIVIAQSWRFNMRAIFVHPLGPILGALAIPECFPRKISEAVLAHHLQKGAALAEYFPDKSAIVIDGMSLVHNVGQNGGKFGDIAAVVLSMVLKEGTHRSRIDIVFDTYRDMSIKNVERTL